MGPRSRCDITFFFVAEKEAKYAEVFVLLKPFLAWSKYYKQGLEPILEESI
jgi:hypothetical protein